ncbi:hypothetical protein KHA80_12735 [Anaerobacillus sp. HL2]|nr:hypothetical protein KHA80_12735 [Anaerobacillus sp. HL2]
MVPLRRNLVTMFGIQPIPKLSKLKVRLGLRTEWRLKSEHPNPPAALVASFETSKWILSLNPITYTDTSHTIGSSIVNRNGSIMRSAFLNQDFRQFLEVSNGRGEVNGFKTKILLVMKLLTHKEYNEIYANR